ncbi:GatB/YqeY domain-containing protein [Lichenibacterium minor]|uniref:GatB/YqeY domain-containing protein n=1 Tax=Lichenibacterium minor TaxID=2316528 RepID=A0A4Q2U8N7_9HYPH|nr:GatB/YqeY domain-containing protein [Lichenibacterium minor]RYC31447.1 GatB/YqeY domain-containing protein [Lichenibacterium minor]
MREQLPTLMKEAMKAGDKKRLGAIRLIGAAMKDREIEARGAGREMTDEDEQAVLRKMVKQRQDSIVAFEAAGRDELAAQERDEVAVLSEFLPQMMDEGGARAAISAAIAETGAAGPKDMGKVIAAVKAKHAGQVDFGKASAIVKEMLAALG